VAENPTRVEAFSDGVFAIAITLLILEIRVPHVDHGLWNGLLALWPSYVAFLLSFVVILIMWVNHHELLRMVDGISYPFLFANGLLLLTITFVPFPTAVLAAHLGTPEARTAVTFYCGMRSAGMSCSLRSCAAGCCTGTSRPRRWRACGRHTTRARSRI